MLMPKAAMHEHDLAVPGKDEVWTPRQVFLVGKELEATLA
jgi:hypothetical protein